MRQRIALLPLGLLATGCQGYQTALANSGAESANFLRLFTLFMAVCTIMYLLVVAGLLVAMRKRRTGEDSLVVETGKHNETAPILKPVLIGWSALIAIGLFTLTLVSFLADRSNATAARDPQLVVRVTGNQWWWNVQYDTSDPSKSVRTANEIHLPVNVPVHLTLKSNDVIHSFWVPNLAGKQDLIPGRVTDIALRPTRTGVFRGQCAEFCGVQHAHMALDVVVEPLADFQRWYARQLAVAPTPATPLQLAGYRYVVSRECSSCHNIAGTPAGGQIAPDLTHVASRRSLAAGTLPLNRGNLYGWIADPQSQKPGSRMPTIGMEPNEIHAIVAYLETLK